MQRLAPHLVLALFVLLFTTLASTVHADERIVAYESNIAIATDGSMTVTERIHVRAEGNEIKHGIYRDFPTDYRDPLGNKYKVAFDMLEATRDGHSEDWHSESRSNGVRIYLGGKSTNVSPGEHEYSLRYRTNRQLGFFDDHDELYWNVTGNGWIFPIDAARATITLPEAVPIDKLKAFGYTGPQGSLEESVDAETIPGGARYAATRALGSKEGLSVVLEFPKGIITQPDASQKAIWLLQDNRNLIVAIAGLLLLWLYYLWAWNRWGRDPASGVRIPLYEPPDGDSAAALRYVRRMGFDQTCFSAGILGLAAKGHLRIDQDGKDYTLVRTSSSSELTSDEKALDNALFEKVDVLLLKQSQRTRVTAARSALSKALAAGYEKKYFNTHTLKLVPGVAISLVTLFGMLWLTGGDKLPIIGFMTFWLTIWTFGTFAVTNVAWQATKNSQGTLGKLGSTGAWLLALPFILGELIGLGVLGWSMGAGQMLAFIVLLGTNVAFYQWMKAPTQDGAKVLDRIDGFRWYLGVAEKQELDSRYKPESRPELFAAYLPYAVALDVGNAWAKRFTDALTPAQLEDAQPSWYRGTSSFAAGNLAGFSSGLSSGLSSAISSASTSPGSSSGGSGGGGSGGGGGGGGGGGW